MVNKETHKSVHDDWVPEAFWINASGTCMLIQIVKYMFYLFQVPQHYHFNNIVSEFIM